MAFLAHILTTLALVFSSVFAPASTAALGLSLGGRIIAAIPCEGIDFEPEIWIQLATARVIPAPPEIYIYTPETILASEGPPTHSGQELLGIADTPFTCGQWIPIPVPPYLVFIPYGAGMRLQYVGVSII